MEKHKNHRGRVPLKIALIVIGAAVVLTVVALILGLSLLNRVTRPGDANAAASLTDASFTDTADDALALGVTGADDNASPTDEEGDQSLPDLASYDENGNLIMPQKHGSSDVLPIEELYPQTHFGGNYLNEILDVTKTDKQVVNILLIGSDRRGAKGFSRADTMMIATLDSRNGRLKLTTLMRDMLVPIEGHGYSKLNNSMSWGGIELLFKTIEDAFHIHLDRYVFVDFAMFESIVDKLGGVTVEMTAEEISAANDNIAGLNREMGVEYRWDGFIFAEPGPVKLTGKQALGYARIRKIDSEFKRTDRQFGILATIFTMFKHAGAAAQYQLLYDLLPMVETNLTNEEIVDIALKALSVDTSGILHFRIPNEGMFENGRYNKQFVFLCDLPANSSALHDFIYNSKENAAEKPMLTPGASLPPRTPTPGIFSTPYYDENGVYVPAPVITPAPEQTPYIEQPAPDVNEPEPTVILP